MSRVARSALLLTALFALPTWAMGAQPASKWKVATKIAIMTGTVARVATTSSGKPGRPGVSSTHGGGGGGGGGTCAGGGGGGGGPLGLPGKPGGAGNCQGTNGGAGGNGNGTGNNLGNGGNGGGAGSAG